MNAMLNALMSPTWALRADGGQTIYIYIYMICVSRPRPPTPPVTHSSSAPSCAWSMLAVRHLTPFYTVKLARLLSTPLAPYEFNAGDLVHSLFSLQVELL